VENEGIMRKHLVVSAGHHEVGRSTLCPTERGVGNQHEQKSAELMNIIKKENGALYFLII
jgi:hypothetical protein